MITTKLKRQGQIAVDVLWASWQMLRFRSAQAHAWLPLDRGHGEMACSLSIFFAVVRHQPGTSGAFAAMAVYLLIALVCTMFGMAGARFLLSYMCASIGVDALMITIKALLPAGWITEPLVNTAMFYEGLVCIYAGIKGFEQLKLDKQRAKQPRS